MGSGGLASGAVTVVSHHITSYALVAILFAFVIVQPFLPRSARSWRVVVVFLAVAAMVVGWDLGVATATLSYIKPIIDALLGRHGVLPNSHKQGVSGTLPVVDSVWEYASTLLLVVLACLAPGNCGSVAAKATRLPSAGPGGVEHLRCLGREGGVGRRQRAGGSGYVVRTDTHLHCGRRHPHRPCPQKAGPSQAWPSAISEFRNGRRRDRHPRRLGSRGDLRRVAVLLCPVAGHRTG